MDKANTRSRQWGRVELLLRQGNIIDAEADALVTAANAQLRGGGGVDGAIHAAAGPQLLEACRAIGGCPTGSAVITPAFALSARGIKHIIHAVGPIYQGGGRGEEEALAGAYHRSLSLADEHGLRSIAFPSISTGAYGFPLARAARIGLDAIYRYLTTQPATRLERVELRLYDDRSFVAFASALESLDQREA